MIAARALRGVRAASHGSRAGYFGRQEGACEAHHCLLILLPFSLSLLSISFCCCCMSVRAYILERVFFFFFLPQTYFWFLREWWEGGKKKKVCMEKKNPFLLTYSLYMKSRAFSASLLAKAKWMFKEVIYRALSGIHIVYHTNTGKKKEIPI